MENEKTFQIGMPAFEVVRAIVQMNPEISKVYFWAYVPAKYFPPENDKTFRRNPVSNPCLMGRDVLLKITYEEYSYIISQDAPENQHLGFLSRIELESCDSAHIPLMDFSEKTGNCLEAIKQFLSDVGQSGVILSSGRSYHFYGSKPICEEEWQKFMGYCILAEDDKKRHIADRSYIGHSLIDKCAVLRISCSTTHPTMPRVVTIVR